MRDVVYRAYSSVSQGFSEDRVVADPELNARFETECRRMGLKEPLVQLNSCLLNLRKGGGRKGQKRSTATTFKDAADYQFASEIAVRHLEIKKQVSLDRILCDPKLREEFDEIAYQISPGQTPLKYRWAALRLRKGRKLRPELVSRLTPPQKMKLGPVEEIDLNEITRKQGLYIFYDRAKQKTLYIGEAANLRSRLAKHLDHSDNKGLARWFWEHGFTSISLEVMILSDDTSARARKALEADLIASRNPVFNTQSAINSSCD